MQKPLFIFDFDGTLADTKDVIVEIGNRYAAEVGADPISDGDMEVYREEGVLALMKKRGLSAIDLVRILKRGSEMFTERSGSVKLVGGIDGVIRKLGENGVMMAVVTSNTDESVKKALGGIAGSFSGIFPEKDLFGKAAKLKRVVKAMRAEPRNSFYVGDEPRDMAAAVKAGIHPIGVSWGFGSERSLIASGAERIARSPEELVRMVDNSPFSERGAQVL